MSRLLFPSLCLLLDVAAAVPAGAATVKLDYILPPDFTIPDNTSVGVADFQTVTTEIRFIESVEVTVKIEGGFNGDYYMYLRHGGGFAVLMNRPGVMATEDLGYADSGVAVVFLSNGPGGDFHSYQTVSDPGGGPVTGVWEPDGRITDPLAVTDADARTATLGSFFGEDANGEWTLFVADRNSGGTGRLVSWSLNITGAVPEPGGTALMVCGGGVFLLRRRRRGRKTF